MLLGVVADEDELLLGCAADWPLWSVELGVELIEPVALLWPLVPVELVVPTWLWSDGVVVVVVVVWLPSGFVWLCDIDEPLLWLGDVLDWSCELVVCAAATPNASRSVAAVIPNVRIVLNSSH